MQPATYPIDLTFKINTLANDFVARDASGKLLFYVRQKMFKLIDEVSVFADETKQELRYTLKADKWLDFSAAYSIRNNMGKELGKVTRKGWASLWKLRYDLIDAEGRPDMVVKEEKIWIVVMDTLLGEVPGLGLLTGYFFNPSYLVSSLDGAAVARLRKRPSFWGRKFSVEKLREMPPEQEERVLLSLMMIILNERRRG